VVAPKPFPRILNCFVLSGLDVLVEYPGSSRRAATKESSFIARRSTTSQDSSPISESATWSFYARGLR
jgi:hypothetical protein